MVSAIDWDRIQGMAIALGALAILVIVPIVYVKLRRRRFGTVAKPSPVVPPGHVHFSFHRYSGFLIFVSQRRYDAIIPLAEADVLLGKLVRHNLTWGLLVYGGPLVPIFTLFEWRSQRKRNAAAVRGFPVTVSNRS